MFRAINLIIPVPGIPGILPVLDIPGILPVPGITGILPVPGIPGSLPVPGIPGSIPDTAARLPYYSSSCCTGCSMLHILRQVQQEGY